MGFRLILYLTLMCFGVFLYVISPEDISAHGRLDRIEKKEFAKYEIGFGTNPSPPRVGFTRLIVTLDDRDTQTSIIGESITIVGMSPNSEKITVGPAFAKKPENVSHYNTSRAEDDETGFNKSYIDGVHKSVHVNDSITSCDDCYDLSDEMGWRELRANYMANVTLLDKYVGKVLDALSESGQSENTIVVFTSDHGDMLGDHRHLQKRSFYEESSKVPLLIKVPWISKEQKFVSGSISLVDLLPTLLDLIDQKIPENLQGSSRKKVLLGQENLDDNDVFYEWNGVGNIDLNKQTIGVTQDDKSGIS